MFGFTGFHHTRHGEKGSENHYSIILPRMLSCLDVSIFQRIEGLDTVLAAGFNGIVNSGVTKILHNRTCGSRTLQRQVWHISMIDTAFQMSDHAIEILVLLGTEDGKGISVKSH